MGRPTIWRKVHGLKEKKRYFETNVQTTKRLTGKTRTRWRKDEKESVPDTVEVELPKLVQNYYFAALKIDMQNWSCQDSLDSEKQF